MCVCVCLRIFLSLVQPPVLSQNPIRVTPSSSDCDNSSDGSCHSRYDAPTVEGTSRVSVQEADKWSSPYLSTTPLSPRVSSVGTQGTVPRRTSLSFLQGNDHSSFEIVDDADLNELFFDDLSQEINGSTVLDLANIWDPINSSSAGGEADCPSQDDNLLGQMLEGLLEE